jgi:hypothetical protein
VTIALVGGLILAGAAVAIVLVVVHHPTTPSGQNGAQGIQPPVSPTTRQAPTTTSVTTTSLAPGLSPVDIRSVASFPEASEAARTFQTYFGGIDNQNYAQAYMAYSPMYQSQSQNSEPSFAATHSTTLDSNIVITSIRPNSSNNSLVIDVTFTSNQAANEGPVPGETCTEWSLAYPVIDGHGASASLPYLIDSATGTHVGCPGQPYVRRAPARLRAPVVPVLRLIG